MFYLTLASCVKDELLYIKDFISYHRHVGVEKFVFYDREYHQLRNLLKEDQYPDVQIIHFPENAHNVHAECWAQAIAGAKGKTRWLACIDLDQAIVPVKTDNIQEVLKDYESFASLQCNWKSFGSSGRVEKGEGSVYERFLMRAKDDAPLNNHTQFLCDPNRTKAQKTHDPHHPIIEHGQMSVNTNKQPVNGPFNIPPLHDIMWIAHYINKSQEEWIAKNKKGRADIFNQKMPMDLFEKHEAFCNAEKEERVLDLWRKTCQK